MALIFACFRFYFRCVNVYAVQSFHWKTHCGKIAYSQLQKSSTETILILSLSFKTNETILDKFPSTFCLSVLMPMWKIEIQCRLQRSKWCYFILCKQVEKNHSFNAKVKLDRKFEYWGEKRTRMERRKKKHYILNIRCWNSYGAYCPRRKFHFVSSSDLCYARLHSYWIYLLFFLLYRKKKVYLLTNQDAHIISLLWYGIKQEREKMLKLNLHLFALGMLFIWL